MWVLCRTRTIPVVEHAGYMTTGLALGSTGLLLTLGILALIDSTSIGTLVIPIWMVIRARNAAALRSAVFFLGVLATFYLLIGLLVLSGVGWLDTMLNGGLLESPILRWVLLIGGAGMLTASFTINKKPVSQVTQPVPATYSVGISAATAEQHPTPAVTTQGRWGHRLDKALGTRRGVALLGLTAGLLELPTMLPYLGAIGLLTSSGRPLPLQVGLLVLYCLVMIIPALLIIGIRAVAGQRLTNQFNKLSQWLAKASGETLAWIVGIIGFLLIRSSIIFLFPPEAWNPFK